MARSDIGYVAFSKSNKLILNSFRKTLEQHIRKTAPKEYHDSLIPTFAPGCKRIIIDPGYLHCLHQPNVDLCWETIDSIVENGIRLKSGKVIELDVIILATGFELLSTELKVQGSDGRTLEEYFIAKDGPYAYLGTCVPGFPNFFTLLGPHIATGHASVVFGEEVQIQYSLQLIKPVIDGLVKSFEVKDEATDAYNDMLQKRLKAHVTQECRSYYRTDSGRNFATFPGTMAWFYWLARNVEWKEFKSVGAEKWDARRKVARQMRVAFTSAFIVVLSAAVYLWTYGN